MLSTAFLSPPVLPFLTNLLSSVSSSLLHSNNTMTRDLKIGVEYSRSLNGNDMLFYKFKLEKNIKQYDADVSWLSAFPINFVSTALILTTDRKGRNDCNNWRGVHYRGTSTASLCNSIGRFVA